MSVPRSPDTFLGRVGPATGQPPAEMRVHACSWCGENFERHRKWQKFCSKQHRWAYHNLKKLQSAKIAAVGAPGRVLTPAASEEIKKLLGRFAYWPPGIEVAERVLIKSGPGYWLDRWTIAFQRDGYDRVVRRLQHILNGGRLAKIGGLRRLGHYGRYLLG